MLENWLSPLDGILPNDPKFGVLEGDMVNEFLEKSENNIVMNGAVNHVEGGEVNGDIRNKRLLGEYVDKSPAMKQTIEGGSIGVVVTNGGQSVQLKAREEDPDQMNCCRWLTEEYEPRPKNSNAFREKNQMYSHYKKCMEDEEKPAISIEEFDTCIRNVFGESVGPMVRATKNRVKNIYKLSAIPKILFNRQANSQQQAGLHILLKILDCV